MSDKPALRFSWDADNAGFLEPHVVGSDACLLHISVARCKAIDALEAKDYRKHLAKDHGEGTMRVRAAIHGLMRDDYARALGAALPDYDLAFDRLPLDPVPDADRPTIEQVAWVFRKVSDAVHEPGSFRYLIYDRMAFDEDAYSPLYCAGGMTITNALVEREELIEENAELTAKVAALEAEVARLKAVEEAGKA